MSALTDRVNRHVMHDAPGSGERIAHLAPGDEAMPGYEIARILGTYEVRIGTGTNMQTWYVVALRPEASA